MGISAARCHYIFIFNDMHIRNGVIGLLLLLPVGLVAAQGTDATPEFDPEGAVGPASVPAPANTVSCFDYYSFGSVQANLNASVVSAVSGTPIAFKGTLKNNNPYPIVDGALYVKVFKSRGSSNDGNGPDVVDQFFVKGDIVIPANGSVPLSFQWRVPAYAQSGDYQLATFFTSSRKFNLLGLPFTDDVVGNTVPFKVSGEQTTGVKFDKAGVTVNDEKYYFAAFPPRVDGSAPAVVDATIRNTTSSAQTAIISWVVYQWDGQLRENAVQEETRQIPVPAGGRATASITVRDTKYPVYLVVGTLKWQDTQSVIGVRFVREGVDRTRINFPGVMSFPLVGGQENTLFSCLHNSGEGALVPGGRLELTLSDASGNPIHEYVYSGDVTGAMMGVAEKFTLEKTYDYFTLDARLFQGEEFIDEAHMVYDCQRIDPNLCSAPPEVSAAGVLGSLKAIVVIVLAVIVLLLAIWIYRRLSHRPTNTTQLPPL